MPVIAAIVLLHMYRDVHPLMSYSYVILLCHLPCLLVMAEVYANGIQPVRRDGRKVIECYERALPMLSDNSIKINQVKGT